ncbi:ester cyclase [Natrialba chahannaoensis]|nr:ester cyclase [Natrialba chahannaoensis]
MSIANKTLVRRDPEEIWSAGNLDTISEVFAEEFVLHDPAAPDEPRDRDDYRAYVETYREVFPDVTYEVDSLVAESEFVSLRYTAHGTHKGEFFGIKPTGTEVSVTGMELYRVENGAMVELWTSYDVLGLFQQLGVVPPVDELVPASRA